MTIMVYPVEDEWAAEVLDLPGCVGAGDTPQEALNGAIDAGRAWLKLVHSLGEKPPKYSIAWLRVDKEGKIEVGKPLEGWYIE